MGLTIEVFLSAKFFNIFPSVQIAQFEQQGGVFLFKLHKKCQTFSVKMLLELFGEKE